VPVRRDRSGFVLDEIFAILEEEIEVNGVSEREEEEWWRGEGRRERGGGSDEQEWILRRL